MMENKEEVVDKPDFEAVACVCHYANRALCRSFGDWSHSNWEDSGERLHESFINGVRLLWENPAITPAEQHEEWCNFKRADGWIYGPVKDATAKTHPCLVPYESLSTFDRAKDEIFQAVARAMMFERVS